MPWVRGLVGLLALAGVVLAAAAAGTSRRPPVTGDGVSLSPFFAGSVVLAVLLIGLLVVASTAFRRRVDLPEDDRRPRRGTTVVLVLFVVLLLAPQVFGGSEVDGVAGGDAAPLTGAGEAPEAGRVTSSPTATLAGVLAMVLALATLAARMRPSPGRADGTPDGAAGARGDDPADRRSPPALELDDDPRLAVLAAYDAARRLVEPAVGASPNDGPLALLARTRGTPVAGAFEDLTRAYLPLRFGTARGDGQARDAARDALARVRDELRP